MILVWVFILVLNLPSQGGEKRVVVESLTEASCNHTRTFILDQLGGEKNLKGTVTKCEEKPSVVH